MDCANIHCQSTFAPTPNKRYCSRRCKKNASALRRWHQVKVSIRERQRNLLRMRERSMRRRIGQCCNVPLAQCLSCHSLFVARKKQVCCRPRRRPACHPDRPYWARGFCESCYRTALYPPKGPLQLQCECGQAFESIHPNAKYCSSACRHRAGKRSPGEYARRRAAHKIRRLRPVILEQFGSVCYLCRKSITIGPASSHPLALTIDHVWPVTANGPDTIDNLRPAHRHCNEDKGERLPAWWELRNAGLEAA